MNSEYVCAVCGLPVHLWGCEFGYRNRWKHAVNGYTAELKKPRRHRPDAIPRKQFDAQREKHQ